MSNLIREFCLFMLQIDSYAVDLAFFAGIFFVFISLACILFKIISGLRLYVFSQLKMCRDKAYFTRKYGKWAVISGSTEGIGLGMAKQFARRGMSIVLMCYSEDKLAKAKAEIQKEICEVGDIITICADLSDSSSNNFDRIKAQIDPDNRDIGVLINNVGLYPIRLRRFHKFDMKFTHQMVNLNILATLHLTRMILPSMLHRNRGLIVNVSSIAGHISLPFIGGYGATKHFVCAFSRQLQDEYSAKTNIDIICLTPGIVRTNRSAPALPFNTSNIFNPTPEQYAKCSVNAMTTRIGSISGTWAHGICSELAKIGDKLKLIPKMMSFLDQPTRNITINETFNADFPQKTK